MGLGSDQRTDNGHCAPTQRDGPPVGSEPASVPAPARGAGAPALPAASEAGPPGVVVGGTTPGTTDPSLAGLERVVGARPWPPRLPRGVEHLRPAHEVLAFELLADRGGPDACTTAGVALIETTAECIVLARKLARWPMTRGVAKEGRPNCLINWLFRPRRRFVQEGATSLSPFCYVCGSWLPSSPFLCARGAARHRQRSPSSP